jgi:hypothetical protein
LTLVKSYWAFFVAKTPKADNAQHVPKIVELDDFDVEETKVAKRQPLKRLKATLLLPYAFEEENKQGIETHEEDSQTNPKKTEDQRTTKKIQQQVMLFRNAMCLLFEHIRTLCIELRAKIITKYTLDKVWMHINDSNNTCIDHPRK